MRDEDKTKKQMMDELAGMRRRIAELEGAEVAGRQRVEELTMISEATIALSRCQNTDEICELIGKKVYESNNNAYVVVSLFDRATTAISIKAYFGFGKHLERALSIMGKDPRKMLLFPVGTIDDVEAAEGRVGLTEDECWLFTSGRLELIPDGIYALMARQIPRNACKAVERFLGIDKVYSIGFALEEIPYGGVIIMTKKGESVKHKFAIETLVNHSSVVMNRKQAEEELRKSEERHRKLVELSFDGIAVHSGGQAVFINAAGARVLGATSPEQIIGKPVMGFVHPDYREIAAKRIQQVQEEGKPVPQIEEKLLRLDGTVIDVEVLGIPITHQGQPATQLVFRDITGRKRMEEELVKAQKLESVGILAGGIAHDFNNILTGILGNISLARMYDNPGDKDRRLAEAERACMQAKDLTQQLLTFSSGGAPIRKAASIAEMLRDSAIFALRGSNVRCEFSMPDDLWSVEVDEAQMNQVISNIVINAGQAMPNGGIARICAENITIGTEHGLPLQSGAYIEVSIQDQGVGIPQEHLGQIFDPYFTTKQEGSGLGLAAAYSIVKKHDGHITAESEVGVGATFHIYLPASPEAILVVEEKEEERPIPGEGRLLVMDDEKYVRDLAAEMLSSLGYTVATAIDGAEAIEMYQEARNIGQPFDAVILDLTVPGGMGGEKTIQRLVEIDPEVKGIVSSGYSNDPILADFGDYGFQGVIAKPYKIMELSEVLYRVVTDNT